MFVYVEFVKVRIQTQSFLEENCIGIRHNDVIDLNLLLDIVTNQCITVHLYLLYTLNYKQNDI